MWNEIKFWISVPLLGSLWLLTVMFVFCLYVSPIVLLMLAFKYIFL